MDLAKEKRVHFLASFILSVGHFFKHLCFISMYSVLNKLSKYIYFYISKNFLKLLNAFNVSLNHEQRKMARMLSVLTTVIANYFYIFAFAILKILIFKIVSNKRIFQKKANFRRSHSEVQIYFIQITLWHGCSPANLLRIFRKPFYKNTYEGLLL